MRKFRYSLAVVLGLPLIFTGAEGADRAAASGLAKIAPSNFVHASARPWQTQCEWNDADGKARVSLTEGRDRPDTKVVPATAGCRQVRRFAFPSGASISETRYQLERPAPVQSDASAKLVYAAHGRARHELGGAPFASEPRDAFIQTPGQARKITATSADYVEIAMNLLDLPQGEAGNTGALDKGHGDVLQHRDVAPVDICFVDAKNTVMRKAANAAIIPADAPCFLIYGYGRLKRGGYTFLEVEAKKGSKTIPHPEDEDTITYYVKGRVRATIGGETQEMGPGDAIFEPRGVPHADEFLEDTIQIEFKLP